MCPVSVPLKRALAVLAVVAALALMMWLVDIAEDACAPDNPDRSAYLCEQVS